MTQCVVADTVFYPVVPVRANSVKPLGLQSLLSKFCSILMQDTEDLCSLPKMTCEVVPKVRGSLSDANRNRLLRFPRPNFHWRGPRYPLPFAICPDFVNGGPNYFEITFRIHIIILN